MDHATSTSDHPTRRRPNSDWLSIRQYARAYNVDPRTVRKWIDYSHNGSAILVTFQIGSVIRIKNLPPSS